MLWTIFVWVIAIVGSLTGGILLIAIFMDWLKRNLDNYDKKELFYGILIGMIAWALVYFCSTQPLNWYGSSVMAGTIFIVFLDINAGRLSKDLPQIAVLFFIGLLFFTPTLYAQKNPHLSDEQPEQKLTPATQLQNVKQKKVEIKRKLEKDLVKLLNKYKTEQSILQKKHKERLSKAVYSLTKSCY